MVKFRAKAIMFEEELDALGIEHAEGYVEGNLVGTVICGPLAYTVEDAIIPEWWVSVNPESIHQIEYTEFDNLCKKHGFFRASLIFSGLSEEEVIDMTEDEVEGAYEAMQSMAEPY